MRSIFTPREPLTSSTSPDCHEIAPEIWPLLPTRQKISSATAGKPAATAPSTICAASPATPMTQSIFPGLAPQIRPLRDAARRSRAPARAFRRPPESAGDIRSRRQHRGHRVQRRRARVVAVVDQRRSIRKLQQFAAHRTARASCATTPRASAAPMPQTLAAASAASALAITCRPAQRQFQPHMLVRCVTKSNAEPRRATIFNRFGAKIRGVRRCRSVNTRPGRVSGKRRDQRIVGIQHRDRFAPFSPSINSRLASAISSTEAKNSRCAGATRVTTPTSGRAISASRDSSPRRDMPISSTAA